MRSGAVYVRRKSTAVTPLLENKERLSLENISE